MKSEINAFNNFVPTLIRKAIYSDIFHFKKNVTFFAMLSAHRLIHLLCAKTNQLQNSQLQLKVQ